MNAKLLFTFVFILFNITAFSQTVKPPLPFGALPDSNQLQWQKLEYYMFIHFGPNTFTDKEWGHGDEDPKVFNPTQLDAKQWARTAKAAGMKGIIITAKHHDGFCLWPSKYSTHTVRESAWKDGKGDVLRELSDACKQYGLKFGVYLSPWDRNHPAYGTEEYNTIFANTLQEVLTSYGDVFEQWFDGANGEGPNGKKQEYNWPLFHKTVYQHQPQAIIFSDIGPGCRWVGNENGIAGTTNWSTLNTEGFGMGLQAPPQKVLNEGNEGGEKWIPAEADVSIRPGWFYSPATDDKVKSLNHLLNIYYGSVGRNANLLLNIPVDRRGLIHANDSTRLIELRKTLDETFINNLTKGSALIATNTRGGAKEFAAQHMADGNYETYWSTDDDVRKASFTINLDKVTEINRLLLQEYISLGQRVSSFSVDYWDGKQFKELDRQTTIGYKRILTFPVIKTSKVRVNILDSKACPVIAEAQLYKAPELLSLPQVMRNKQGDVKIQSESADVIVTYTTDGTEPTYSSKRYIQPFKMVKGGTVKAKGFISNGTKESETVTAAFDLAPVKWKVISSDDEKKTNRIIDENQATVYQSSGNNPQSIVVDLGEIVPLKGFSYLPRKDGNTDGIVYQYNFYVSNNGKEWKKVIDNASFANIKNNPVVQKIQFNKTYKARFIKLESLSSVNGDQQLSVAELSVLTL